MEVFNPILPPSYSILLDEASPTITYVGEAIPGSATSEAVWRIKRLDSSAGLEVKWANGTNNEDKIWDDRTSYAYS